MDNRNWFRAPARKIRRCCYSYWNTLVPIIFSYLNNHWLLYKIRPITKSIVISTLLVSSLPVHALSATTASTIKGHKPQVSSSAVTNKLQFVYNGSDIGTAPFAVSSLEEVNKFQANYIPFDNNDYFDIDDDLPHPTASVVAASAVQRRWLDADKNPLYNLDFARFCENNLSDKTIFAELSVDITIQSAYGDPSISTDKLTKLYQLDIYTDGLCLLAPLSEEQYLATGWGMPMLANFYGFWAPTVFPTTGFSGAQFKIRTGGDEDKFTWHSTHPSVADINPNTGVVTIKSKGNTGTVTLTGTHKTDPSKIYTHTFATPLKWFTPNLATPKQIVTYPEAETYCISQGKQVPDIDDLVINYRIDNPTDNFFDYRHTGTLIGEWGGINDYPLAAADWGTNPASRYEKAYYWSSTGGGRDRHIITQFLSNLENLGAAYNVHDISGFYDPTYTICMD